MTKLLLAAAMMFSLPAYAEGRRTQVNERLADQHARINAGVRDGSLTRHEATKLRREDRAIRAEERAFAAQHNGRLTRGEQRLINRQENKVSRDIYRERHDGQRRY